MVVCLCLAEFHEGAELPLEAAGPSRGVEHASAPRSAAHIRIRTRTRARTRAHAPVARDLYQFASLVACAADLAAHRSADWSRDGDLDPALYPFSQEDYDVTIEEFSYNAALVWRPEFGGTMRFSTGRGVLAPTMFDIGFGLPVTVGGNTLVISGDPNIEPAIVTNYEIAYDRSLSPTVDLRAALFYHETEKDRGAFGPVPDLFPPAVNAPLRATQRVS